ncbi:hypothetical protein [Terrarubrum flagellatum]|uniref:hypothetical protein n=1 Tax=Terrirubrum flagellatum TaxID=2895980 RepID=UPI0031450864
MISVRASFPRIAAIGAAIAGVAIATSAVARDVRYCFALDPSETRFYASTPFETTAANDAVERAFARELNVEGLAFRVISCPRNDDMAAADAARQSAIDYNVRQGKTARSIDWIPAQLAGH